MYADCNSVYNYFYHQNNGRFDFVKAIGNTLIEINLPKEVELTGKVLLGIMKQGPVYVRPKTAIESVSQLWYFKYLIQSSLADLQLLGLLHLVLIITNLFCMMGSARKTHQMMINIADACQCTLMYVLHMSYLFSLLLP